MNEEQKSSYIGWLNDAHALELSLVTMLEKQIAETEDMPDMQSKLKEHLEETKRHVKMVESAIERNGGSISATKDFMGKVSATVSGLGMSMMDDAMVKNVHSSYAAEHAEIATYTLLQAAADFYEDEETATMCGEILEDEIDMADWLLEQLPIVVEQHLTKSE